MMSRAPLVASLALAMSLATVAAQTRFTYSSGQSLSPAYEGWIYNADGTVTMYFGYMNTNWLQEFDIPIGPDNAIEPGGPDQGQPTHFYPRRSPFLFTIKVPKDLLTQVNNEAVLAVSLEPLGGSPTGQPTGPVIANGKLAQL